MRLTRAFTIIELIFVIVVLGILASVALPKFGKTGTNARVASGKADVMAIRSGILSERQKRLVTGQSGYITGTALNTGGLFKGVLTYAKQDSTAPGKWHKTAEDTNSSSYTYNVDGVSVAFTYTRSNGTFTCSTTTGSDDQKKYCKQLIY